MALLDLQDIEDSGHPDFITASALSIQCSDFSFFCW